MNFYTGRGPFSLIALDEWIGGAGAHMPLAAIRGWLPASYTRDPSDVAKDFVRDLEGMRPASPQELDPTEDKLIEFLFARGFLPAYAFPRDLCALQIEVMDRTGNFNRPKVLQRPQQSLNVALSEYAPGRLVVVDKKTYRVGTVAANGPATILDRAERLFADIPRSSFSASPTELLRSLGAAPKHAEAIHVVEQLAKASGLLLLVDGLAARLVAEGWLASLGGICKVFECRVGLTDGRQMEELLTDAPAGIAVLDANLAPLDVYARPLLDAALQRIAGLGAPSPGALVMLTLSNGVAALPVPQDVRSIALKLSLDYRPQFLSEADALSRLEELCDLDGAPDWIANLWKPAQKQVLSNLRIMTPADIALALSVLDRPKDSLVGSTTAYE